MTELSFAAILVELTGLISAGLGIFCRTSRRNTAWGFGSIRAPFEVTDLKAYNRAVGNIWLACGIITCLLGGLLVLFGSGPAVFVAIAAFAAYTGGSAYYVLSVTPKYRKRKSHEELWKDAEKKQR